MKVVRFAGGLGNIMFQYALYLQVCKLYPNDEIYIDTIWYEFTGYPFEFSKVFSIKFDNNFYTLFTQKYGIDLASKLDELRYWKKFGFDYYFSSESNISFGTEHYDLAGRLNLDELPALYSGIFPKMKIISELPWSIRDLEEYFQKDNMLLNKERVLIKFRNILSKKNDVILQFLCALYRKSGRRRLAYQLLHFQRPDFCRFPDLTRIAIEGDAYFNLYGNPIDCSGIREQLLQAFSFPKLDEKNHKIKEEIIHSNAVAIHTRVNSFQYGMGTILDRDYYKKAVNYIKSRRKEKLKYFVFSDNVNWCKENFKELGLQEKDDIIWVKGNTGDNSYKDMQLMTYCKYHIVPNSTFSWWGGYLSQRNGKMMITPYGFLPGTVCF